MRQVWPSAISLTLKGLRFGCCHYVWHQLSKTFYVTPDRSKSWDCPNDTHCWQMMIPDINDDGTEIKIHSNTIYLQFHLQGTDLSLPLEIIVASTRLSGDFMGASRAQCAFAQQPDLWLFVHHSCWDGTFDAHFPECTHGLPILGNFVKVPTIGRTKHWRPYSCKINICWHRLGNQNRAFGLVCNLVPEVLRFSVRLQIQGLNNSWRTTEAVLV